MPMTVAVTVFKPMRPLVAEMRSLESIPGMLPSFEGPNSTLWLPMSASISKKKPMSPNQMTEIAKVINTTSTNLQPMITLRLLNRSARYPAGAASNKYGSTKKIVPAARTMEEVKGMPR